MMNLSDNYDGPEQAFELLVREYKSTIYSVCYMYAEERTEAYDLFQEALINLWQGGVISSAAKVLCGRGYTA